MVLLDLGAVPRAADVVLERVSIDEDQGTDEADKKYEQRIAYAEEPVDSHDAVAQEYRENDCVDVVKEPDTMPHQVPNDWHEAK